VNETVKFQLRSPDVIHSFWVPAFTYKLDVFPGSNKNDFTMTPVREGTFEGRCAVLCGTYHSRMLFNVVVESKAKYAAYLKSLEDQGNTGLAVGGGEASAGNSTQSGSQSESGANR
jgi:cytochrome c oxidase subunit 2